MDARKKVLTTVASLFIAVLGAARLASADSPLDICDQECWPDECPDECMEGAITGCVPCAGSLSFFAMANE